MTPEEEARIRRDVANTANEVVNAPIGAVKVMRIDGHPWLKGDKGIGMSAADFTGATAFVVLPLSQALTLRILLDALLEDYEGVTR